MKALRTISKFKLYFFLSFLVLVEYSNLKAGDGFIRTYRIGVFAGIRNITCDSFAIARNPDFVNSFYTTTSQMEAMYLGISLNMELGKSFETDFSMLFVDSYLLNNLNLKLCYIPFRNFGIAGGYYSFDYFMNDYDYFFRIKKPGFHIYDDDQFFQRRIEDHGFLIGPLFRLKSKKLSLDIILNSGFVRTKHFVEHFYFKENNSSLRETYSYDTQANWTPVFSPELKFRFDIHQTEKSAFGMQLQSSLFIQDKVIDYKVTSYSWTTDNFTTEEITNPRHQFIKAELDFGIYFRW